MADTEFLPTSTTQFYDNSILLNAVAGTPIDWIDDNRLLVLVYKSSGPYSVYDHATILDNHGNALSSPQLPAMNNFDVVSSNQILNRDNSQSYDLTTGLSVWNANLPGGAGAAGGYVIYNVGSGVFLATH